VWCDTPYAWDWTGKLGTKYDLKKELTRFSPEELLEVIPKDLDLVITGGEPLLQAIALERFISILPDSIRVVEIETAGTVPPLRDIDLMMMSPIVHYNVSPKLGHSGNLIKERLVEGILEQFLERPTSIFKFVVQREEDIIEIESLRKTYGIPRKKIWLMPECLTREEHDRRLKGLAATCLEEGYNLSPRLQVEIWGNVRGV